MSETVKTVEKGHAADCKDYDLRYSHCEIDEIEMAKVFGLNMSMTDTCLLLVDMANANGGHDNITAICIAITEDDIDE